MDCLCFGVFLVLYYLIGEFFMFMFWCDVVLVVLFDELGYDEYWVGEYYLLGWEIIALFELYLVVVGERIGNICFGMGVISLLYYYLFNVV